MFCSFVIFIDCCTRVHRGCALHLCVLILCVIFYSCKKTSPRTTLYRGKLVINIYVAAAVITWDVRTCFFFFYYYFYIRIGVQKHNRKMFKSLLYPSNNRKKKKLYRTINNYALRSCINGARRCKNDINTTDKKP